MANFSSFADTAYSLSVVAFPIGLILGIGAGGAINQKNLIGFWLTFPPAILLLTSAFLSSSICLYISFELKSLQCWATGPSRSGSIDSTKDFGWGMSQYIGVSAISLLLIIAIWYRYKKGPLAPVPENNDHSVKGKPTLKSKLAFWSFLEFPFWK